MSCESEVLPMITLDSEESRSIIVSPEGDTVDVVFTSSLAWTAEVEYLEGAAGGWLSLNTTSGDGGYSIAKIKVAVSNNDLECERQAMLIIKSAGIQEVITIVQQFVIPEPEPAVFNLVEGSAQVGADGGQIKVTVQFNVEYEYTIPVDWVHEVETKAVEEKVHSFEIDANTVAESRSATLSFCGNGICIPFTITQDAAEDNDDNGGGGENDEQKQVFELSTDSASVGADGGNVDVTVTANVEYEYTLTADWVVESSVTEVSEIEKRYIFEVKPNTGTESRSVTVSFCGNGVCHPFTITQEGPEVDYNLTVDNTNVSVPAEGTGSPVTVNVASNMSWTVTSDSGWCTVSPASGQNDGSFTIIVSANASDEARVANVTVSSADGMITRNVAVVQAGMSEEYGDDSWKSEEFHHRSFAMRFTGDWCGYCPQMATAMKNADSELGSTLEVISVHGGGSTLQNTFSLALVNHYAISNYPTGLVDGRTFIQNQVVDVTAENIVAAARETESTYGTLTGVSWTSQQSDDQVVLNLSTYLKKSGSYKVTAYLVEDKIIGYQSDYTNGSSNNYEHNGVLKAAFTDVFGEEFTISEDYTVKTFTYSVSIPSGCVNDNLRIVVFVEKADSDEYYVDNSATEKIGVQKHLAVKSGNWVGGNEGIIPGDDITL